MVSVTISVPDPMREFIEKEVRDGGFASVSEYIRALIREAQQDRSVTPQGIEGREK